MLATLFDIKHYAIHDGPGIRQTIFFKGCPLNCCWCHNPESQSAEIEYFNKKVRFDGKTVTKKTPIGYQISSSELLEQIEKDKVFYDESNGGVTFSGGEPLLQFAFLLDIAQKCFEKGIHTALDTCGFIETEKLKQLLPYIDLFLYDIKFIDNQLHKKYTGMPADLILQNLAFLDQVKHPVIIRIPLIPEITDTEENLNDISGFLDNLNHIKQIDLLPYHDISKSKYQRFGKALEMPGSKLEKETIDKWEQTFEAKGFTVTIGGQIL